MKRADFRAAAAKYDDAAGIGDAYSMAELAAMLFRAMGGHEDKPRAFKLWQDAADAGDIVSACQLAYWLGANHSDNSIKKDPKRSAIYMLRAIDGGSIDCRALLQQRCSELEQDTRVAIQDLLSKRGAYHGNTDGKCEFGSAYARPK